MKSILLKLRLVLFLSLSLLFIAPHTSESFGDIPYDNLAYPVLLIATQGLQATQATTGSGFFCDRDDAIYFLTARHNLFKETSLMVREQFIIPRPLWHKIAVDNTKTKGKRLLSFYGVMSDSERDEFKAAQESDLDKKVIDQLHRESQKLKLKTTAATLYSYSPKPSDTGVNQIQIELPKLYQAGRIMYHPSSDVALIRIATLKKIADQKVAAPIDGVTMTGPGICGLSKDTIKLFNDVLIGNTIYTFGYPTSISVKNPFMDIKLPLLRKGIVSGKNNSLKVIILDCPIFHGNSGGLVIEAEKIDIVNTNFRAIGLVTNFVPYAEKQWLQNSGYSIAVPMDFVEELFKASSTN